MNPHFFKDQHELRKWLEKNHDNQTELIVGLYKKGTKKENMSWSELVDQVLCFGWIDGRSKSIDDERWCIRITPRKADSIWSAVNINKMEVLTKAGLMQPAGHTAFAKRKESKSKIYSHESQAKTLAPEYEKQFKSNPKAWEFFNAQPPGYRKVVIHLIMTAKQEKTRISRLESVIADSAEGKRWKQAAR
ncbi:YdeI/OmpD-associated family protein [Flavobacterium sp.]|uniref:YdeI/OmpD-associated family protein n=1 Tax=Flavobacterium sp. TaxID=239 RepID=UPI0039E4BA09